MTEHRFRLEFEVVTTRKYVGYARANSHEEAVDKLTADVKRNGLDDYKEVHSGVYTKTGFASVGNIDHEPVTLDEHVYGVSED